MVEKKPKAFMSESSRMASTQKMAFMLIKMIIMKANIIMGSRKGMENLQIILKNLLETFITTCTQATVSSLLGRKSM